MAVEDRSLGTFGNRGTKTFLYILFRLIYNLVNFLGSLDSSGKNNYIEFRSKSYCETKSRGYINSFSMAITMYLNQIYNLSLFIFLEPLSKIREGQCRYFEGKV